MFSDLLVAILAAGASRRLGQPKQLMLLDGETLLRRQCRIALEANIGPVVVILGCHADRCAESVAGLPLSIRLNEHWTEGLAASIRMATSVAIETNSRGLLILHADQYRLTAEDLQNLHVVWAGSGGVRACRASHRDYFGPPVILPSGSFRDVLKLKGDQGARPVLASFPPDLLIDVPMPSAVYDLDLPEQISTALRPVSTRMSTGHA
jgi:CTP:molybdopterin cytidylyltransferase MocA